jgi:hypothetical protein
MPMTFTAKHLSDFKLLLGSHTASFIAGNPNLAKGFEKHIAGLHETMQQYFEKVEAIRVSGRYSQDGEWAEIKLAARATREKLGAVKAETVDKLEAQLSEKRTEALKPKIQTTDPFERLLREQRLRELRDHLRTVDPVTLQARIRQAVEAGANTDLLDALEGAPAGFPIAPAELVREARIAIAERDHPVLGELATLRDAYTYALGVADQTLVAASGLSSLEISTDPAPTGGTQRPYIVSTGQPV